MRIRFVGMALILLGCMAFGVPYLYPCNLIWWVPAWLATGTSVFILGVIIVILFSTAALNYRFYRDEKRIVVGSHCDFEIYLQRDVDGRRLMSYIAVGNDGLLFNDIETVQTLSVSEDCTVMLATGTFNVRVFKNYYEVTWNTENWEEI